MIMTEYKVVIPSAGVGSRLVGHCDHINKTLVPVANKPIIAYIIDKFDPKIEIVIALGYKGDLIQQFLKLAYPERKFTFIDVDPYDGPNSGLGYTLLSCKHELQCPFVFFTNDAIITEEIPSPDQNWIGYADIPAGTDYRSVVLDPWDRTIAKGLCEKGIHTENGAYIGICGIKDYEAFWLLMEKDENKKVVQQGESYALAKMVADNQPVLAKKFTWLDTGTIEALEFANDKLRSNDDPVILPKTNEYIWFCNDKVIKFSTNPEFISKRVKRAKLLEDYVPAIIDHTDDMYCYSVVDGQIMSKAVTPIRFQKFLKWLEPFWENRETSTNFREGCLQFYRDKTLRRVQEYFDRFDKQDTEQTINDTHVPTITKILDNLDWHDVADGQAVRFHGDLHFENVLYQAGDDGFCLLDWREDFAGIMDAGDIYYDFAKLLHGFIISHELIAKNSYHIQDCNNIVQFDLLRKHSTLQYESDLQDYVISKGYNWHKVEIITALIYLNIASLHHEPYAHLLFYLGKLMLYNLTQKHRRNI